LHRDIEITEVVNYIFSELEKEGCTKVNFKIYTTETWEKFVLVYFEKKGEVED